MQHHDAASGVDVMLFGRRVPDATTLAFCFGKGRLLKQDGISVAINSTCMVAARTL